MISHARDTTYTSSAKIGNTPNDPKLNLNSYQSKVLYIHYTPEAQILFRFVLRLAVSEIQHEQGRQKSEILRMTPNKQIFQTNAMLRCPSFGVCLWNGIN